MRRLLRWLLVLGVLAGLTVAVSIPTWSWWQQHSRPRYLTAEISRGRVETVVNSTGTIKPVLSVSVGAFTSGPIAEVYVDYNSVVKKGMVIARIDPKLATAALERDLAALKTQQADLKRVEALLNQAKNNEIRAGKLRDINKDYLSENDLDQYHFTHDSFKAQKELGEANITLAEANVKNSNTNLGYTEITSPVDGIVIERKVDPGQTVAASFQTPELFVIAPEMDKHMYVYASVDEADIGLIQEAKETNKVVKFTVDAYPGELFEGHIHQIRKNATTTQNVVTYPVVIEAPNPKLRLMPGMTANLSFEIEAKEDVLRVPAAALRFVPLAFQVRPEDRHYVEAQPAAPAQGAGKSSASDKADQARKRHERIVWVQDGDWLRAVRVTLGQIENPFAELLVLDQPERDPDGNLAEGQAVVTGTDSLFAPR
jgi:HlyD family secretion protein